MMINRNGGKNSEATGSEPISSAKLGGSTEPRDLIDKNLNSVDKKEEAVVMMNIANIPPGEDKLASKSDNDPILRGKNTNVSVSGKSSVNCSSVLEPVLEQVVDYVLFSDTKKLPDIIKPSDINMNIVNDKGASLNGKPVVDVVMKDSMNDGNTCMGKGDGLNDSGMGNPVVKTGNADNVKSGNIIDVKSVGNGFGKDVLVQRDAVYISFAAKLKERRKEVDFECVYKPPMRLANEVICEKRPRTEAELAAAAAKTQILKEKVVIKDDDGFQTVGKKNRVIKMEGKNSGDQGAKGMGYGANPRNRGGRYGGNNFRSSWVVNWQKGGNRKDGQQQSGGPQVSKQGNFEKGETSGVIKKGNDSAGSNTNGGNGNTGKINTVINNSGNLDVRVKEDKSKDKQKGNGVKSQNIDPGKVKKGNVVVQEKNKKGSVSDVVGINPFDVLMEVDLEDWEIRKSKVDMFLNMQIKPTNDTINQWDEEMMKYFKENSMDDTKEVMDLGGGLMKVHYV
ncbi:hypothetical protein L6452_43399 [Arctium lappa]|uniref:Uncharacterized protein n=2 Tax=Arctium lappa TaxID=4217 RepID=A0ACB8XD92_ARCLA|nr:hypothetical protein L6452_43394 [Arctium lappa]KAI3664791.1 hypothetical protein L6452_43399 [Arctium lappa]